MKTRLKKIILPSSRAARRGAHLMAGLLLLAGAPGCGERDNGVDSPFGNVVYLDAAKVRAESDFTFKNTLETASKDLTAELAYPADADVDVQLSADPSLVAVYNARHGTDCKMLDAGHWSLGATRAHIQKGEVRSAPVKLDFRALTGLELDAKYVLPVRIVSATGGVQPLESSATLWYVVTRSSAITTAVSLKDNYFEVPGFDAGSPTASVVNGLEKLTYEAIIRVDNFQPQISSVMGIEQYCLLRIGDSGFPNAQLQFCSPGDVKFPKADKTKTLLDKTWYHVAVTYDTENRVAVLYVDGREQSRIEDYGNGEAVNLGKQTRGKDFMFKIGHSYGEPEDYSRQLDGAVCEVRVWGVVRTQEEIFASMYDVDPKTPGLLAYWKFNEGSGDVVKDWTGNGNDAVAHKPATWPDGILVPKKNE